jgi:hypothetical protein
VHTNIRKYHCAYCERAFKQLSHLQQHTRIHTGKSFACLQFNRLFFFFFCIGSSNFVMMLIYQEKGIVVICQQTGKLIQSNLLQRVACLLLLLVKRLKTPWCFS